MNLLKYFYKTFNPLKFKYAVESQIKLHNLKATDCIISLKPRKVYTIFGLFY